MSVGFLTGKFAPLHTGHIYFISKAATMVDKLYVVLSYDGKRFKDDPRLSLKNRLLWLKTTFKDLPHITVTFVDETDCRPYPDGWGDWAALMKSALLKFNVTHVDKIFSSEPEYTEGFNKYWPEAEHVIVDAERKEVNISATEIRANPFKFWSYMPEAVQSSYENHSKDLLLQCELSRRFGHILGSIPQEYRNGVLDKLNNINRLVLQHLKSTGRTVD